MRAYLDLLRLPGALRFCVAAMVARSGGAMMGIGQVLMVSMIYDSYGLAGAVAGANGAAWAVGTAILASLVDRHGQRKVMYPAVIVSSVTLAALILVAVLHGPAWMLFPPAIISGATGGAPGAMVRTRWSHVTTTASQLHTAYALESTLDEINFVIGPVVATALATGVHPTAGIVAPIVLGLAGSYALYSQRATEPPIRPRLVEAVRKPLWRRIILLIPGAAAVMAVNLVIGAAFGSIDVSVVAATRTWGNPGAAGLVLAVFSVASAMAGFIYGARAWPGTLPRRFLSGVIGLMVFSALLWLAGSPLALAAFGFLVGLTVAPTLINGNSLMGRLVPAERLTEGLAWMGTSLGLGSALGSGIAGEVIDRTGYEGGLLTVLVCGVLAGLIAIASYRSLTRALGGVGTTEVQG